MRQRRVSRQGKYATANENLALTYDARTRKNDPVTGIEVWVNGGKVNAQDQVLSTTDEGRVGVVRLKLPSKDAIILLKAYSKNGASEPAQLQTTWLGGGTVAKPNLNVLAVGVSKYERTNNIDLKFAAKDAQDFVTAAEAQEGGLYERVIVRRLLNNEARSQAILDELDWLRRQVTNNDVAMVYFSGHGIPGGRKGVPFYIL
jgi:hypothetical protein